MDNGGGGKLPKELHTNAPAERRTDAKDEEEALGLKADVPVVTPSMRQEGVRAALGWVMVLTKKDLWARGYTDLSQILDDLPGTDVVRPWGDVYVRSYIRGNRTVGADPYVLLIDGVEMNQLYTGSAQILAALPISNVQRIEIVLGPVSSVYGPNAAMGVIHVITDSGRDRQEAGYYGASADAHVVFGGPQSNFSQFSNLSKMVDASASYIGRDYRFRLTARLESSVFDTGAGNGSNFNQSSQYTSATNWGAGTLNAYPNLAGALPSPDRKGAVDARVFLGRGTEIAAQFFSLSTGYGVEYPGDRRQAAGPFTSTEWSAYARHTAEVTSGAVSTSLIQFRKSDIDLTSLTNDTGSQVKLLEAESPSMAALVREDFEINTRRGLLFKDDQLGLGVGLRYQYLSLPGSATGQYVTTSSVWAPTEDPRTAAQAGSDLSTSGAVPGKGVEEIGAYLLARYSLNRDHHLNLGVRLDNSSAISDVNVSARVGYSGTIFDMLTFKIWYGHSIFEPSWQQQLAATVAPAVAPSLAVSGLHNVEGDIDFALRCFSAHVDGYFTYETNPVVAFQPTAATAGSFVNMGDRKLAGIDVGAHLLFKPVTAWVYYTHDFHIADGLPDVALPAGNAATQGDIAANKIWAGLTVSLGPFTGTLLNRWMMSYDVVPTNPSGAPGLYSTLDANLMLSDLVERLWFALRVTNIIGTTYNQPGIQTADSGTTGGTSKGPFSSWLPQPGRGFFATLGFRFDQDKPLHPR